MRFTIGTPFGSFETGQEATAAEVSARHPGADLDRLVRIGSLVPVGGAANALVEVAVSAEEEDSLLADLQKRVEEVEAERDLHKEDRDRIAAERDAMAAERDALGKRVKELEAAAKKAAKETAKAAKGGDPTPAPAATEPPAPTA